MKTRKHWAGRVLRTDMLGTDIRNRARHYYLMFNREYARIFNTQKLHYIKLLLF